MAKIDLEKLLLALDKVMPNGDLMRFNLASALAILGTSFEEIRGNQEKISPFEANIQPGDKIVFNEDMGCRVNLSQLNRVAKPSDPEWNGKIGSKHAEGKLKEMLDKRQEQNASEELTELELTLYDWESSDTGGKPDRELLLQCAKNRARIISDMVRKQIVENISVESIIEKNSQFYSGEIQKYVMRAFVRRIVEDVLKKILEE